MKEKTIRLIPSLKTLHHLALTVILLAAVTVPVVSAITHISLPSPVRAMTGNGSADNPYIVANLTDLQDVQKNPLACYRLANDIDASETATWNGGLGFEPLGVWDSDFPTSDNMYPITDNSSSGTWIVYPASPVTMYDKIDEATADDDTTYIEGRSAGAEAIVSTANITGIDSTWSPWFLTTWVRQKKTSSNTATFYPAIKVNGTVYAKSTPYSATTSYYTFPVPWTTNPETGVRWTVADLEGTGSYPLEGIGVRVVTLTSNYIRFTQIYASASVEDVEFEGSFDGDGHTISNLTINRAFPENDYIGLFGATSGADIFDLTITGANITTSDCANVGILLGLGMGSENITNCHVQGTVTSNGSTSTGGLVGQLLIGSNYIGYCTVNATMTVDDFDMAGALVGVFDTGTIEYCQCTSTMTLIAQGGVEQGAGLAGWIADTYIYRCWANVNMTLTGGFEAGNTAGGLGGCTYGNHWEECFVIGSITDEDGDGTANVGGMFGRLSWGSGEATDNVVNCYSRTNLYQDVPKSTYYGGFVSIIGAGDNHPVYVTNCYSTGNVASTSDAGGFIWLQSMPAYITVTACYWDNQTSGKTISDGGIGLPTANMTVETTFTSDNWDFDDIWCMPIPGCNDGYPILQNNLLPGCSCMYLLPPENLIATPISSTRIDLSWYNPNSADDWPDLMVVLRSRTVTYPADPPSGSDSWLVLYRSAGDTGDDATSHINLDPGTTYFYRVWFYEPNLDQYTTYSQDFATTFAGVPPDDGDEPPEWFREPSCISYYNTPLWPAMNYAIITYEWPEAYFCMAVSLLLISIVCLLAYGVAAVGTQGSVKSIAVPFILGAGLIGYGGTAMSLFPLGITIVSFIMLAGIGVFVWTRA